MKLIEFTEEAKKKYFRVVDGPPEFSGKTPPFEMLVFAISEVVMFPPEIPADKKEISEWCDELTEKVVRIRQAYGSRVT